MRLLLLFVGWLEFVAELLGSAEDAGVEGFADAGIRFGLARCAEAGGVGEGEDVGAALAGGLLVGGKRRRGEGRAGGPGIVSELEDAGMCAGLGVVLGGVELDAHGHGCAFPF